MFSIDLPLTTTLLMSTYISWHVAAADALFVGRAAMLSSPPPLLAVEDRIVHLPRYFFHVRDHVEVLDEVGTNFPGTNEARAMAVHAAGEMLKDLGRDFWDSPEWKIQVVDEAGATVCTLRFSAETNGT